MFNCPSYLGKISILTNIFFKWVETTNYIIYKDPYIKQPGWLMECQFLGCFLNSRLGALGCLIPISFLVLCTWIVVVEIPKGCSFSRDWRREWANETTGWLKKCKGYYIEVPLNVWKICKVVLESNLRKLFKKRNLKCIYRGGGGSQGPRLLGHDFVPSEKTVSKVTFKSLKNDDPAGWTWC